jgi:cellobiose phosphorylase
MPQFQTEYGTFSDDGLEYIITRPDTPVPWVNVISNKNYGLVLSQAGGGYSWLSHASLNRITRWEQDLIRDEWGKFIYLRDVESGEFWSPSWQPAGQKLDEYRVRHGQGYSVIESRCADIETRATYFVPLHDPCEIWQLQIINRGIAPRRFQVFTYFEWLLGAAPDWHREFHRLFIRTWFNQEKGALLATKVLWDLPGEIGPHWNRDWAYVAFHSCSIHPSGYDAYKEAFLGRNQNLTAPKALIEGRSLNTTGFWGDAIGSLQVEIELEAGQGTELIFTLGAAESETRALDLAERYQKPQAVHAALDEVKRFWQGIGKDLVIETPEPALNLMANTWLPYQLISGRLWGRTAYYQTGGAFGFRDQLQDSLIWLLLGQPEQTLAQIHLHAAHQFQDGVVLHWWHPLAESGLRSEYSDDLLWLPFVVMYYIYETGETGCLTEEIPYFDQGSASLFDHCMKAFEVALSRRSERGLPLILQGDWNDGLNAVGDEGRGESMWMAAFLYMLLTHWEKLPNMDALAASRLKYEAEALRQAANEHGWDGNWYWRATTDEGSLIGSSTNEQGQIFLNPQTWSVLSGLAPDERARQAMDSVREHLYTPFGALLLAPAYHTPDPSVGYLSRYAPGTRENGGVYVHAACWAVLAERKAHGVQAAYDLWRSFCPPVRGMEPDIYMAEPFVMPGNVDGPASQFTGRGGWTWYTGSAAWYLRALVEGVLGIEATMDGLRVQAALPDGWDGYRIKRRFRRVTYDIQVQRAAPGDAIGCTIDGQPWQAETLPILEQGTEHLVKCTCR